MKSIAIYLILVVSLVRTLPLHAEPAYMTSIHPFATILQQVVGERATVHRLLPPGTSPHTYELRPSDLRFAESSTAVFYGSPQLDEWVARFPTVERYELLEMVPPDALLPLLGDHHHDAPDAHQHAFSDDIDPHFWTDPLTVKAMLPQLVATLCEIDPPGCGTYTVNAGKFAAELDSLHHEIARQLAPLKGQTVIMSHPFFHYFLVRYGIKIAGVIETIPGKESTPREIQRIIKLCAQEHVRAILSQPQTPDRVAAVVSEATGIPIIEIDPIGGVPGYQTYAEIMRTNAQTLLHILQDEQ